MSNRRNYFWAATLGLILMLFVSVAVSRVVDLHFRSWTNWPGVEVDGSWGRFARSAVEIMEVAVIPVTLVVGTYLGWQAVHHRPKPYLAGLAAAIVSGLVTEWTSSFGQDATRAEVQKVSTVSLIVMLFVFLFPIAAAAFMLRPAKADSPHTAVPPQSG